MVYVKRERKYSHPTSEVSNTARAAAMYLPCPVCLPAYLAGAAEASGCRGAEENTGRAGRPEGPNLQHARPAHHAMPNKVKGCHPSTATEDGLGCVQGSVPRHLLAE